MEKKNGKIRLGGWIEDITIDSNGTIYTGSSSGKFFAILLNGTLKWVYSTDAAFTWSPAIINGVFYG
ncbi:MAG: PQQ-binding-like beta-propeller repeat protein, partial [Thermoplasmata archaeon]|nr:PQQ-binding-like beta-propeller repeat protein [Thermoplasmata archaeon]